LALVCGVQAACVDPELVCRPRDPCVSRNPCASSGVRCGVAAACVGDRDRVPGIEVWLGGHGLRARRVLSFVPI